MKNMNSVVKALEEQSFDTSAVSRRDFVEVAVGCGFSTYKANKMLSDIPTIQRGIYNCSAASNVVSIDTPIIKPTTNKVAPVIQSIISEDVFIPSKDVHYVSWGNSSDINTIVASKEFFPTFISGLSGNGKTMMVEQACAKLNREYIRIQITPETDEDDLLGGFRLINGETVFAEGPVIKAMRAGAILLIDEIDRGTNKLMALQGVLEGKPVLLKKSGVLVHPQPGFNVIATANTKGRGSEDGRFIAASIIDEAFLERFTVTVEQPYPSIRIETKIVQNHMEKYGVQDEIFGTMLVTWAEVIRKTYDDGGIDEQISTRRLCHIVQSYAIFKDRMKAIKLCVNRFEEDTKEAFLDLYAKVDVSIDKSDEGAAARQSTLDAELDDIFNSFVK